MKSMWVWIFIGALCCGLAFALYTLSPSANPIPSASASSGAGIRTPIDTREPAMKVQNPASSVSADMEHFLKNVSTLSDAERKQTAQTIIDELKASVSDGADPRTVFQQIEQFTPYVEPDPTRREAMNFEIWQSLRQANVQRELPPTPAEQQQLKDYAAASDQIIEDVMKTESDREQQHRVIDTKLRALRLQIFGEEEPRVLRR
ncbi:phospholipase C accessory protein PlcR [Aquirhabdus parva]|uniref:Phospholipase C accessory protein PlcR n=1 Tax=Aquirhabdus parva TaxID=2283318 RepID=A0A345P8M2_9GAMM|nr:phospholipase C accessory protein PlcR [Aquirhabdus parva]AXI03631.1 phospholipase C accessory protein PlcR [Aquirhabdus parva]